MGDSHQNRMIILGMALLFAVYNLSDSLHIEKFLDPYADLCMNRLELYPGKLHLNNGSWAPKKCILKHFTDEEILRCSSFVPLLSIGDGVGKQIVGHIMASVKNRHSTLTNDNSSVRHLEVVSTRAKLPPNDSPLMRYLSTKAEFVMMSFGLWDFGVHFCGPEAFFDGLMDHIKDIKKKAKPSATLAILNLQHFHPENCHEGTWCRTCVTPERASIYREVIQQASACTGVGILDMTPITKQGKKASPDGVHYMPEVLIPKTDVLMNTMCNKMQLWHPQMKCDEASYIAKWNAEAASKSFPEGCPDYENEYGCPYDDGRAADRFLLRKELMVEAEIEIKQSINREPCTTNAGIYPGKLLPTAGKWSPSECSLKQFNKSEVVQCLTEKPFLSIGDSLGEQVFWHLFNIMKENNTYINRYNASVRHLQERSTRFPFPVDNPHIKFLMNKARMVVISAGLWDFGIHFCGPMTFYKALKEKVLKYRALLKRGATLALYNLHYFFPEKCEIGNWCRACNSKEKIAVFREAVQLVSACTGVGMIDPMGISSQGEKYTFDGTHYFSEVIEPKANLVLNVMCGEGEGLGLWYPALVCDEKAAGLRWARVPDAHNAGEGCPEDANQFGCINDEGESLERYELRHAEIEARKQVVAQQNAKPKCQKHVSLYPGVLSSAGAWIPNNCRLQHFTADKIVSCLNDKPFLSIGDSIGEQFMHYLLARIHTVDPSLTRYTSNARHLELMSTRYPLPKVTDNHVKYLIKEAMMVVISLGMWDFGVHFCSPVVFYESMKEKVLKINSLKQQGAKVALLNLQAFHPEKCDHEEWCRTCNKESRVKVFRQAVQLVAACTGVGMIDHVPITEAGTKYTSDGVHWGDNVMSPKVDVVLNAMCGDEKDSLGLWEPPIECDEQRYFSEWQANSEVMNRAEKCPNSNEFGCPETVDETEKLPVCTTNKEIYPGKLVSGRWIPEKCRLKHWGHEAIVRCLTAKPYLSIGDSIGDQLELYLLSALHSSDPLLSRYDSDSRQLDIFSTRAPVPALKEEHMQYLRNEALIVTMSFGLWDFGIHFCSPSVFYDGLKEKVLRIKSLLQPGAKMALLSLHYFHPEKCEHDLWCRTCFVADKVQIFRQVVELVSVCTGVGLLDTVGITKQGGAYTSDGVHFDNNVLIPKADVLLGAMCPDSSEALELYRPEMKCDEDHYKLEWVDVEAANKWSPGCPLKANDFGCPDEDGERGR